MIVRTRHQWLARLLTAPGWHGPVTTRKLWSMTGMLDYGMQRMNDWTDIVQEPYRCDGCGRQFVNLECLMCDGAGAIAQVAL